MKILNDPAERFALDCRRGAGNEAFLRNNKRAFQQAVAENADLWLPASGGTEAPFTSRSGIKLLYCYNAKLGKHAYLDCGCDRILTDEEAFNALQLF